jgi:hypothetical protein
MRRLQAAFEMHLGGHQRRNPQAHELPEDMAERQRVQKAQRMHQALVAQILLHLALDGLEAGEDVAMGVHDALGLGRGARGEENLQRRLGAKARLLQRCAGRRLRQRGEIFQHKEGKLGGARGLGGRQRGGQARQQRAVGDQQARPRIGDDAQREGGIARGIERNRQHAAQHASEKRRDPLGAVLSPQHHALAAGDVAANQLGGETPRQLREIAISGGVAANAAMHHHGGLGAVAAEVFYERGQMRAHNE